MSESLKIIQFVIDDKPVEVEQGATILQAANKLGISIPTMCHKEGYKSSTSCMVCIVQVEGQSSFIPSCGALAQEGMKVRTNTPQVLAARKAALELLLGEHAGDCEGPCRIGCPANMNIPLMLRQIIEGRLDLAIQTIKKDIALPAVLGRICPAPCEKVCRRNVHDGAVSICLLKRFAADWDLMRFDSYQPQCKGNSGKRVAIVGAGPCGLAAAYYLAQAGVRCVLFDKNKNAGGKLRTEIQEDILSHDILDGEINKILTLDNVEFRSGIEIGTAITFESLLKEYDAVFIASGENSTDGFGLEKTPKGVKADFTTYQTGRDKVFAGGGAIGRRRMCVRAVADGKEAAVSILQQFSAQDIVGPKSRFNSRLGQLVEGEMEQFLAGAEKSFRCQSPKEGLFTLEAMVEAKRCLRCDCGKADNCKLRELAELNQTRQQTYRGQRKPFIRQTSTNLGLVFEPGKCILCGLCVQAAGQYSGSGLAFAGRGFETRIAVPLSRILDEALTQEAARRCVEVCPTGAIANI
jgi:ferredoxin